MYLEYFALKEHPFRLTPDTEFLYLSEAHARAKSYMEYTVWNREGFVVITGEIGCGKTTLLQKLLSELDAEGVVVAKIFQTQLDEVEFLQAMLVDFGLNPFQAKKVELIDMLNTFLVEQFMQMKQVVLIVDDAHNLGTKVLEEIRLLAGLETRKEKILHVILVGQPQLNEVLEAPEMEQLLQRVRLRYHIRALGEEEMVDYIKHRLRVAGAENGELFAADTFPLIFKYSGGVPRLINTLCDTALVCAYADQISNVTSAAVEAAIEELQWVPYSKRVSRRRGKARDSGVAAPGLLQEQGRTLSAIANQLGKLDEITPSLTSIQTSLTAIESHLRRLVDGDGDEPRKLETPTARRRTLS